LDAHQTHLHSQLAQLSANLADTENLLRMTSVQAESIRGLGSWHGGLYVQHGVLQLPVMEYVLLTMPSFMAASKVLGEESVKEQAQTHAQTQQPQGNDTR
jgi:hypothetical protein